MCTNLASKQTITFLLTSLLPLLPLPGHMQNQSIAAATTTGSPPPGPVGNQRSILESKGFSHFFHYLESQYLSVYGICQFELDGRLYVAVSNELAADIFKNPQTFSRGPSHDVFRRFLGLSALTMEGNVWREKKIRIFRPLNPRKEELVLEFEKKIVSACERMEHRLRSHSNAVDLLEEMSRFTLDAIGQILLCFDLSSQLDATADALFYITSFVSKYSGWSVKPAGEAESKKLDEQVGTIQRVLTPMILHHYTQWKQTDKPQNFYIDELMSLYQEELEAGVISRQLLDDVLLVFFAGHDTTAKLMTWSLLTLSTNADLKLKLTNDIVAICKEDDDERGCHRPFNHSTIEKLSQLPSLNQFMEECLRYYPPVPQILRDVSADTRLGNYCLTKGSQLIVFIEQLHRQPSVWGRDANTFNTHHIPADHSILSEFNQPRLIPFSMGAHRCPGQRLAQLEAKIALCSLLVHFDCQLMTDRKKIRPIRRMTLLPNKPIHVKFIPAVRLHDTPISKL